MINITHDILEKTKELLRPDGWCKDALGYTTEGFKVTSITMPFPNLDKCCLFAAEWVAACLLLKDANPIQQLSAAYAANDVLNGLVKIKYGTEFGGTVEFNDAERITYEDVVALLDEGIQATA